MGYIQRPNKESNLISLSYTRCALRTRATHHRASLHVLPAIRVPLPRAHILTLHYHTASRVSAQLPHSTQHSAPSPRAYRSMLCTPAVAPHLRATRGSLSVHAPRGCARAPPTRTVVPLSSALPPISPLAPAYASLSSWRVALPGKKTSAMKRRHGAAMFARCARTYTCSFPREPVALLYQFWESVQFPLALSRNLPVSNCVFLRNLTVSIRVSLFSRVSFSIDSHSHFTYFAHSTTFIYVPFSAPSPDPPAAILASTVRPRALLQPRNQSLLS